MCATKIGRSRGMVMILVLVLVALLLIVALAVITGANWAASSATAVSIKYRVLNAAEGAANSALDDLAQDPAEKSGTQLSGTLNGANWDAWIRANNLLSDRVTTYKDPATGDTVLVPPNSAYLYGAAAVDGGHTTYVEAIVGPSPPLRMPSGAVNAASDVLDMGPMAISSDPSDLNKYDADVSADSNIIGSNTTVQGRTIAGGSDELTGAAGTFPDSPNPVTLPTEPQVSEAVRTARLSAQAGQQLTSQQVMQAGTATYAGNVFIDGNLTLTQGVVTLSGGKFVYVNGNLCVEAAGAQLNDANTGENEIVVSGNMEVAGGGAFTTAPGANTLTVVLGIDQASLSNSCSANNSHALDFQTLAGTASTIGTIFTPHGSINLTGSGSIAGAVDAGANVYLAGSDTTHGMQYDMNQATTSINTGTLTFNSYFEY